MNLKYVVSKLKGRLKFSGQNHSLREAPSIKGKVYVNKQGKMEIGKYLTVIGKPWPVQLTAFEGGNLSIGNRVFINAGVGISSTLEVKIGNNVLIGPRTSILDSAYHQIDSLDVGDLRKKVIIEDNVWIGTGCIILPGVTIGKYSVIAAGSVVNKDVPEKVVVAGVPAKVIRELSIEEGWIRG